MKMTLLEIVQDISSTMNSDEVNSISDTVESMQIAMTVRSTYYSMIGNLERLDQYDLISFESSGDTDLPTHMRVRDDVDHFKWVRYRDTSVADQEAYKDVCWLSPSDFVDKVTTYTGDDSTFVRVGEAQAYIPILTNKQPQWFTSFDDEYLIFDSYDSEVDDTLQESKIMALGQTIPTFVLEDNEYPDLPSKYFPQLLAEATEACMWYGRQMQDPISGRRARQQYVRHQNNRARQLGADNETPNFGRT